MQDAFTIAPTVTVGGFGLPIVIIIEAIQPFASFAYNVLAPKHKPVSILEAP